MPKLSDSMEEGTIVRWLRAAGDEVGVGDELVEIDTDKATVAYEAEAAGPLTIVAAEGTSVRVGETIARIGAVAAAEAGGNGAAGGPRVKASPVARRLARERQVALDGLAGSGPGGRIVRRDVEAAVEAVPVQPVAGGPPAEKQPIKGRVERIELTPVQATIARRMAEAKSTMPEFTLTAEVDMEAAAAVRAQLAGLGREFVPSLGDFVVKACALALREHPSVNASYRDGAVERYKRVNVGVAVAAPDALFVPTVLDADRKPLEQIAAEVRELADRGRAGQLTPPEMAGATFTVSNLGMFGVSEFTAVLNPPQVAILAVGAVTPRVVVADGAPAVRQRMNVTLSCDHRALYGADAAAFLASVRANLEQPLRLILSEGAA